MIKPLTTRAWIPQKTWCRVTNLNDNTVRRCINLIKDDLEYNRKRAQKCMDNMSEIWAFTTADQQHELILIEKMALESWNRRAAMNLFDLYELGDRSEIVEAS